MPGLHTCRRLRFDRRGLSRRVWLRFKGEHAPVALVQTKYVLAYLKFWRRYANAMFEHLHHSSVGFNATTGEPMLSHPPTRVSLTVRGDFAASRRHSRGSRALAYPSSNALSINEARAKEAHHCKRGREAPAKATIIQISPFSSEDEDTTLKRQGRRCQMQRALAPNHHSRACGITRCRHAIVAPSTRLHGHNSTPRDQCMRICESASDTRRPAGNLSHTPESPA